jgi:hypothetical protein
MSKNQRELSKKEILRNENFEKLCTAMEQKSYTVKPMTFGITEVNIIGLIVMLPFAALFAWIYWLFNHGFNFSVSDDKMLAFLWGVFVFLIVLTVLHELIHGAVWGAFAENHYKSIDFGVIWSMLTPYCTCSEPLKKWQYIFGAVMPTIILGFALAVVAAAMNSIFLLSLAEAMIFGGGGDFAVIFKMLRYRSDGKDTVYFDYPTDCGFVVFEKKFE